MYRSRAAGRRKIGSAPSWELGGAHPWCGQNAECGSGEGDCVRECRETAPEGAACECGGARCVGTTEICFLRRPTCGGDQDSLSARRGRLPSGYRHSQFLSGHRSRSSAWPAFFLKSCCHCRRRAPKGAGCCAVRRLAETGVTVVLHQICCNYVNVQGWRVGQPLLIAGPSGLCSRFR